MHMRLTALLAPALLGLAAAAPLKRATCDAASAAAAVSTCASAGTPRGAGACVYSTLATTLGCAEAVVDGALGVLIGVLVGGGAASCDAGSLGVLNEVCASASEPTQCVYQAGKTLLTCTEAALDATLGGLVDLLVGRTTPPSLVGRATCDAAAVQATISTCASRGSPGAAGECLYTALDTTLDCTKDIADGALNALVRALVGGNGPATCGAQELQVVQEVCAAGAAAPTECVYALLSAGLGCAEGAVDALLGGVVGALVGN
ncbi:hypothetical protein HWV62_31698 [Athelia sp. TMB]|nr:hypothetical protein HWV62_31698 [Athelia sp. TMB]